ncbi:MAG: hypothetical protein ACP5TX_06300 [Thermoplasmata archaeon]
MKIKKEICQINYIESIRKELEEFLSENRDAVWGYKDFNVYYTECGTLLLSEGFIRNAELLGHFFFSNGYAIFTGTNDFYGVGFEYLLENGR